LKKEAELHELAMQQNKDRMQDLEEENATLHQRNAELTDAFTALMEGLEMENIERALKASPEILKTVGCKIAEAAKRNKKDRKG
jgi:ribosomal protein L9